MAKSLKLAPFPESDLPRSVYLSSITDQTETHWNSKQIILDEKERKGSLYTSTILHHRATNYE